MGARARGAAAERRLPQPVKGKTETHRAEQSASRSDLLSLVAALWPSCTFAMIIKPAQAWEAAGVGDGAGAVILEPAEKNEQGFLLTKTHCLLLVTTII